MAEEQRLPSVGTGGGEVAEDKAHPHHYVLDTQTDRETKETQRTHMYMTCTCMKAIIHVHVTDDHSMSVLSSQRDWSVLRGPAGREGGVRRTATRPPGSQPAVTACCMKQRERGAGIKRCTCTCTLCG